MGLVFGDLLTSWAGSISLGNRLSGRQHLDRVRRKMENIVKSTGGTTLIPNQLNVLPLLQIETNED
jgi:hypothetical protein